MSSRLDVSGSELHRLFGHRVGVIQPNPTHPSGMETVEGILEGFDGWVMTIRTADEKWFIPLTTVFRIHELPPAP